MHSRVFQLSKEALTEDDYINEFDLHDCFIGPIADYVVDTSDRIDDLEWLESFIGKYGAVIDHEKETVYFPFGFKKAFFKDRFEEFKKSVKKVTLEQFAGVEFGGALAMYQIETLIENKYGFYIYLEYPKTLDSFVRELDEDTTYYIGAILDYHA